MLAYVYVIHSAVYSPRVRRLQIYIDESLDEALAVEAARTGTSKAALIRLHVARSMKLAKPGADPMCDLIGRYDEDPGSIDEVVYGE